MSLYNILDIVFLILFNICNLVFFLRFFLLKILWRVYGVVKYLVKDFLFCLFGKMFCLLILLVLYEIVDFDLLEESEILF